MFSYNKVVLAFHLREVNDYESMLFEPEMCSQESNWTQTGKREVF